MTGSRAGFFKALNDLNSPIFLKNSRKLKEVLRESEKTYRSHQTQRTKS